MIENTFELLNDLVNYLSKILKLEVRHLNLLTLILRAINPILSRGNRCSAQVTSTGNNFGTEFHWNVNFGIMQKDYVCQSL